MITFEEYKKEKPFIEKCYIDLANELNDTLLDTLEWPEKDGELLTALFLKKQKKNSYTKEELLNMGFGFTLNGDIVTPEEEKKLIEEYINHKKNQWINKACEWLENNLDCMASMTPEGELYWLPNCIDNFRKTMEE